MTNKSTFLTDSVLDRIKNTIIAQTGLVFPKRREEELRQVLIESFNESSSGVSFEEYLLHLESDFLNPIEMKKLVTRLTVGETYFFRNKPHYELLSKKIIPDLVHKRSRTTRSLRIWSAGCSTGEEAYSLAILLREIVPQVSRWNIFILGTDINEESLNMADRAEYREWSFRDINPIIKERYFTATRGGYKIHPEIRRMVTFRYLNLIEDAYPLATTGTNFMDIIMCRNVMMYFESGLCMAITKRFYRALNNGGYLVVGHTEHDQYITQDFKKCFFTNTIVYKKEEAWSQWDRGLKLRFRGSGKLPSNIIPSHSVADRKVPRVPRAASSRTPQSDQKKETRVFDEGIKAYKGGQFNIAKNKFKEILGMNSKNVRACYLLALLEANHDHLNKAKEYCLSAIKNFPLHLESHYLMAVIAREEGDREKEIEYLKKALYINPEFVLGHYQMGVYYLKEGNFNPARKYFSNALQLLTKWEEGDCIEGTESMTIGRLREIIAQYMEEIEAETKPLM